MDELKRFGGGIREPKDYTRRLSKSDKLGFTEKIEYAKPEMECMKMMYTTLYQFHILKLEEERYNPPCKEETNEH